MAPSGAGSNEDKGMGENFQETWELVRDYAKQETIDPIKALGRFVAWGMGGAVAISIGAVLGVLAVLRVLQQETGSSLTGSWNFVPYLVALVFSLIVAALAVRAISKPFRTEEKR